MNVRTGFEYCPVLVKKRLLGDEHKHKDTKMKRRHGPEILQSRRCRHRSRDHDRDERRERIVPGGATGEGVVNRERVEALELADVRACRAWGAVSETGGPYRLAVPQGCEALSVVLGRRLRRLRVERGLSRKQVAERLLVPVEQVEGHERGTRPIEPADLVAYARLFRVRISAFFKEPPTGGSA
jgi:hypothetical protein